MGVDGHERGDGWFGHVHHGPAFVRVSPHDGKVPDVSGPRRTPCPSSTLLLSSLFLGVPVRRLRDGGGPAPRAGGRVDPVATASSPKNRKRAAPTVLLPCGRFHGLGRRVDPTLGNDPADRRPDRAVVPGSPTRSGGQGRLRASRWRSGARDAGAAAGGPRRVAGLDPEKAVWLGIDVELSESAANLAKYADSTSSRSARRLERRFSRALAAEFGHGVLSPPNVNVDVVGARRVGPAYDRPPGSDELVAIATTAGELTRAPAGPRRPSWRVSGRSASAC